MLDVNQKSQKFEDRVLRFIREYNLIKTGDSILIGVSGGADSVCLLSLLATLINKLSINLHVAHLNHQLRGAAAREDADFVAGLACNFGLPHTIENRDVALYRKEHHLSLETAAREVRYSFFATLAAQLGFAKLAVGHTSSDLVETVLMHLIRGSGGRGLSGLNPETTLHLEERTLTIIRPVLVLDRSETQGYCQAYNLTWRVDKTNLTPDSLRNRIRLELLPLLRRYNPGVEKALIRMASVARDDTVFLDGAMQRLVSEMVSQTEGGVKIDKTGFLALPRSLQRNLIRWLMASITGGLKNIEMTHIEAMLAVINRGAGKQVFLPDGLIFNSGYREFSLKKSGSLPVLNPHIGGKYRLKIPGVTIIPGRRFEARVIEGGLSAVPDLFKGENTACFDFDETGKELFIRGAKPGERFIPLGMHETKTIAEFLIDAKVPRGLRLYLPVVASTVQVIWLAGVRIDDRFKVTETTRRILHLSFTGQSVKPEK